MTIFINWQNLYLEELGEKVAVEKELEKYKELYLVAMMEKIDVVAELRELKALYEQDMKSGLDEIKKLRASYNDSQRTINNLRIDIEALKEKNEDLSNGWTREIQQRQAEKQELTEQNRALQQALRERQTDVFNAQEQLKMIKPISEYDQYKELSAKLLEAQEALEEVTRQMNYYRKDSDELREHHIKLHTDVVRYADELGAARETIAQGERDLVAAKVELHRLRDLNCQLEHEVRMSKHYRSTNPFDNTSKEKEELQKQVNHMTENFDRMTKSRDYYREEYNAVVTILNKREEESEYIQESLTYYNDRYHSLAVKYNKILEAFKVLQSSIES